MQEVNSSEYWDGRFSTDWESHEGPRQSRFFATLALENLPPWLLRRIDAEKLTLADWGCAQGDGTEVLSHRISPDQLTGVDFSEIAIDQAAARYSAIRFVCQNWLEGESGKAAFDVVFSSNTLEHFHSPYDVLERISRHASKAVVLALPYREMDRIEEHFFTFLPENIPAKLKNEFRLVWSRVIDCRKVPGAMWGGDQIVLVYADSGWVDRGELMLADCHVEKADLTSDAAQWEEYIATLKRANAEQAENIEGLAAEVRKQVEHAQQLAEEVGRQNKLAQEMAVEARRLDAALQACGATLQERDAALQERDQKIQVLEHRYQTIRAYLRPASWPGILRKAMFKSKS